MTKVPGLVASPVLFGEHPSLLYREISQLHCIVRICCIIRSISLYTANAGFNCPCGKNAFCRIRCVFRSVLWCGDCWTWDGVLFSLSQRSFHVVSYVVLPFQRRLSRQ